MENEKVISGESVNTPELLAAEINKAFQKYNNMLSVTATAQQVKEVQAQMIVENKDLLNKISVNGDEMAKLKATLENFNEVVKKQGETLAAMKVNMPENTKKTFHSQVLKALESGVLNDIIAKKSQAAIIEIETKDVTFGGFSGGAANQVGTAMQPVMPFSTPVIVPEEPFDIRTVVNTGVTSQSSLEYPKEKAWTDGMGNLAENGDASESDATFEMGTAHTVRISTFIEVSRTALKNAVWLAGHISNRLVAKFVKKLNTQVIKGDGLTVNLKGLVEYATTFTAGDLAGKIPNANYIDVLIAARARNYEVNKIKPNVVFVNPLDAVELTTIKSTIGEWANKEPFMSVNSSGVFSVMGMSIIESFDITAGTYLMAAISPANFELLFNGPLEILTTDSHGTNFIANKVAIKLEAEVMLPVYQEGALIKGTFLTDLAAITLL